MLFILGVSQTLLGGEGVKRVFPEVRQLRSHSSGLGLVLLPLLCKSQHCWASANALHQGLHFLHPLSAPVSKALSASSIVGVQRLLRSQSSVSLHLLGDLMLSNTVENEHLIIFVIL